MANRPPKIPIVLPIGGIFRHVDGFIEWMNCLEKMLLASR